MVKVCPKAVKFAATESIGQLLILRPHPNDHLLIHLCKVLEKFKETGTLFDPETERQYKILSFDYPTSAFHESHWQCWQCRHPGYICHCDYFSFSSSYFCPVIFVFLFCMFINMSLPWLCELGPRQSHFFRRGLGGKYYHHHRHCNFCYCQQSQCKVHQKNYNVGNVCCPIIFWEKCRYL